jgi:hypothetical protein
MKIPIPRTIAHWWDVFVDWGDVDVMGPIAREDGRNRPGVRRIDVLLAAGGIFCVGYYGMLYGWMGALQGGSLYLLVMISALGMRQHD